MELFLLSVTVCMSHMSLHCPGRDVEPAWEITLADKGTKKTEAEEELFKIITFLIRFWIVA